MRRKLSKAEIRKRTRAGAYHDGSKPLTAKKLARLKGAGNYHDALVPGLYLQVTTTTTGSAKSRLLRYEMDGRPERRMGLGSLKVFPLAQARERAREARRLIADGIDPIDARQRLRADARAAAAKRLTFRQAAEAYFNAHQAEWSSAEHRAHFLASLHNHVFPHLGELDVAAIETAHILKVLQPLWLTKTATGSTAAAADRTDPRLRHCRRSSSGWRAQSGAMERPSRSIVGEAEQGEGDHPSPRCRLPRDVGLHDGAASPGRHCRPRARVLDPVRQPDR